MERIEDVERIPNYHPKKFTERELKKAGVTIVDERELILRCDSCGKSWSPQIQSGGTPTQGGKLQTGY